MWITEENNWKWGLGIAALALLVGVIAVVLAVPDFLRDISNSRENGKVLDPVALQDPTMWPAGSVEEQVAQRVLDAADAAGCPTGTVRSIEAAIILLPASAQTGEMPLANAHALIEFRNGTDTATLSVRDNGQGATPEDAKLEALNRLLTKVIVRLNAKLDC